MTRHNPPRRGYMHGRAPQVDRYHVTDPFRGRTSQPHPYNTRPDISDDELNRIAARIYRME